MFKISILIILTLSFNACTSKKNQHLKVDKAYNKIDFQSASLEKSIINNDKLEKNITYLNDKFYDFYEEWKNVKYKYGGNSKKGIDCSAFIQIAFKEVLNVNLPRTTKDQVKIGEKISKKQLETGDLIFFQTGINSRHVGIYLEDGKFLHASTKRGVIISKLDNPYYKKHYWTSKRVID